MTNPSAPTPGDAAADRGLDPAPFVESDRARIAREEIQASHATIAQPLDLAPPVVDHAADIRASVADVVLAVEKFIAGPPSDLERFGDVAKACHAVRLACARAHHPSAGEFVHEVSTPDGSLADERFYSVPAGISGGEFDAEAIAEDVASIPPLSEVFGDGTDAAGRFYALPTADVVPVDIPGGVGVAPTWERLAGELFDLEDGSPVEEAGPVYTADQHHGYDREPLIDWVARRRAQIATRPDEPNPPAS